MPLMDPQRLRDLYTCPRCRRSLGRKSCCENCGLAILELDAKPVLVDFEKSVVDRELLRQTAGGSPIRRSNGKAAHGWLTALVLGQNCVSPGNILKFIELARKRAERPRILIVGGARIGSGIDRLYNEGDLELISFDIYSSDYVQFIADAHSIPLPDESVDGVVIQAVLEHVISPGDAVGEIRRVLRDQGVVYAETPFLQHVHEGAYDFTRFTESGHRYLFRDFGEVDSGVVSGPGTVLAWSLESLFRSAFRSRLAGILGRTAFFWVRFLDRLAAPAYAADGASGVYFLGRRDGTCISPKQLIERYRRLHS